LYPPIDEYSDEDHGMPTNIRAKVSFGLSPDMSSKKIPQNLQHLITQNPEPFSKELGKIKNKKPAVQNKAFSLDE
jgi:hypothetical protein